MLMHGYVQTFRPDRGDGAILTESGELYRFGGVARATPLHGGDLVSFEPGSGASGLDASVACEVQLVEKGHTRLTSRQRPLLAELRETVAMDGMLPG